MESFFVILIGISILVLTGFAFDPHSDWDDEACLENISGGQRPTPRRRRSPNSSTSTTVPASTSTIVPASTSASLASGPLDSSTDYDIDDSTELDVETSLLRGGILKFSYGDEDPNGPDNWMDLDMAGTSKCEFNCCFDERNSPINIDTNEATFSAFSVQKAYERGAPKRTLQFIIADGVEKRPWTFGYPTDTWHGIELRSKYNEPGLFEIIDEYDTHLEEGIKMSTRYSFEFAQITYCDPHHPVTSRSSHQIDGKRFPLEINMFFFADSLADDICMRKSLRETNKGKFVMVSVLGEFSKHDNHRLEPLLKAARSFTGEAGFENDDLNGYTVPIHNPFSPSWFIQNGSDYFYYDRGTFVVPPCFSIPRVYVLQTAIPISVKQLEVLTNIPSSREPSGKLDCTFGVLQERGTEEGVHQGGNPADLSGKDFRPSDGRNGCKKQLQFIGWRSAPLQLLIIYNFALFLSL